MKSLLSGLCPSRIRAVYGLSGLKPSFGRARALTSVKALRIFDRKLAQIFAKFPP